MIYNNIKIPIPDYVMYVIDSLELIGKTPYVVGGSVRDYFLQKEPHDFDLVIDQTADKSYKFFSTNNKIDITTAGIAHGTIKLWIGDYEPIDLTEYGNNPRYVDISVNKLYNPTIYDDISRRDFSVNAMVYSPYHGLIDMHNGLRDINNRIIRFIDDSPDERIEDDPFLILRAIRQTITLDFDMDRIAQNSVFDYCHIKLLKNVSGWRRGNELRKILDVDYKHGSVSQKTYFRLFLKDICHYVFFPTDIFSDVNMSDRYKYLVNSIGFQWRIAFLLKDYSDDIVLKILKDEFEYEISDINEIMKFKKELSNEYL